MRLFLIPITPRKAFVYGHKIVNEATGKKPSYIDRVITKSGQLWLQWEKGEKKWQQQLTLYGNKLFRRISYEEWALKSIPALQKKRMPISERQKVPIIFPPSIMTAAEIPKLLQKMGTENSSKHQKLLVWSIVGMPIVAPFALVPVIPNIPFFYLAFRAYSHWRALQGGRHLEFLVNNKLLDPQPSLELDKIYKTKLETLTGSTDKSAADKSQKAGPKDEASNSFLKDEDMLITEPNAKEVAEVLEVPQLVVELERACEQINSSLERVRAEKTMFPDPPKAKL